jgi:argininosuccinate synthase
MTILHAAHRAVESLTLDREVAHLKDSLGPRAAEMIYYGFWQTPEFVAITALIDETQKRVTGTARLKLYKGSLSVVGRRSPLSLYSEEFATFERDTVYNQKDAEGFIKLNALRLRLAGMAGRRPKEAQIGK